MKKRLPLAATYIFLFLTSLYLGSVYIDPDFGWRLRLGNYILQNGIPATDIYSYTMPSFPFIDHEWLTHIGLALLHRLTGYTGLAFIAASIYVGTVIITTRKFDRNWRAAHALFVGSVLLHHFGVKPQILSWFMTALFVLATLDKRWDTRWKYITPFFLLAWANVHGGFIVGAGIYTVKLVADAVSAKRIRLIDGGLYAATIMATVINPYGLGLWEEIIRTGSDARLRVQILEWTPQFLYFNLSSFCIVAWYTTIFIRYFKSTSLYERSLFILLLIFGFSSSRNFPLWVVAASPIITHLFGLFMKEAQKNKITKERVHKMSVVFTVFITCVAVFELFFLYKEMHKYSESNQYPVKALSYLRDNPSKGNMISAYEWGGYLILKYPQKKVFIDGRMPSWRQDASRHPAESPDAFGEFTSFLAQTKPMSPLVKKYKIDTVLIPKKMLEPNKARNNRELIQKFKNALKKNGFEPVYTDDLAVIFR